MNPNPILESLGIANISAVTPVTGGLDTAIWRVEAGGERYALRLFRAEQRGVCALESMAITAAGAAGIPVPTVHHASEWEGRPVMLQSWCAGQTLLDAASADPSRLPALAASAGRMQARLHRVTAPARMQERRADWLNWLVDDPAIKERLLSLPLRKDALIHLDYHPLNLLVEGTEVSAVIDWTNAHAGDPRADLARTIALLHLAPVPGVPEQAFAPMRRVLAEGWLAGYQAEAGPISEAEMAPFYAWGGAFIRADLGQKVGRPGIPFTAKDLEPMDRWTQHWKEQ